MSAPAKERNASIIARSETLTCAEMARQYGVSQARIWAILNKDKTRQRQVVSWRAGLTDRLVNALTTRLYLHRVQPGCSNEHIAKMVCARGVEFWRKDVGLRKMSIRILAEWCAKHGQELQ